MSRNRILGIPQNTQVLPGLAGSSYTETYQDDLLLVPPSAAAGTPYCTVTLNGALAGQQPADGDVIEIADPAGVLGPTRTLLVEAQIGGTGFLIFEGSAGQATVTLNEPGVRRMYMFSGGLNGWVRLGDAPASANTLFNWTEVSGAPAPTTLGPFYGTAFNTLTAQAVALFPAAPAANQTFAIAVEDPGSAAFGVVANGNGNQVEDPQTPGALNPTYQFNTPGVQVWTFRRGAWRLAS